MFFGIFGSHWPHQKEWINVVHLMFRSLQLQNRLVLVQMQLSQRVLDALSIRTDAKEQ